MWICLCDTISVSCSVKCDSGKQTANGKTMISRIFHIIALDYRSVNNLRTCWSDQMIILNISNSRLFAESRTSTPFRKSTLLVTTTHCQSLDMLSQTRSVDRLRNDDRDSGAYTDTPCKKVYAQRSFSESDIPDNDNTQLSVEIVV